MLFSLLTLLTIGALLTGWLGVIEPTPLYIALALSPYLLTWVIAGLVLFYARISQPRWEEYQEMQATEGEGMREFRDVMIGVLVELLTRRKAPEPEPTPTDDDTEERAEYAPPGYEDEEADDEQL